MLDATCYAERSQQIIEAGRLLYSRGWSPATSSNYSARIDAGHLAITVSGRHKGQLTPEDVMVVDLAGRPVQSERKASAETLLHTTLYELFPHVGAVLHTHSLTATVLSRLLRGQDAVRLRDYELQKAFEGVTTHALELVVPIFDNTQDIPALAATTRDYLRAHPATPGYLIRGHGLYTWGRTMADSLRHVEAFEFLLACELETIRITR
ncbi:methylthioribulose 1-phosphate dehydratase [Hyalangium rubrum]|uniref:Methylthioribulose-1-phosphate dehydratase n=1 Tax=Hyalangium rubrum TaxID=3103134 RepID=A0ABU5H3P0_9BACT|nr:methylthioribulose 1-phosphate dehydratase [Hyalangium sp. s54d21]MDY7227724.1 methylthioribulose 1-phosphate dehydratase [Hyalangium sp. s54d21]